VHVAAYKDDIEVLTHAIWQNSELVNAQDPKTGARPLHVAVNRGNPRAVEALLEAGAGPPDEVIPVKPGSDRTLTLLELAEHLSRESPQHAEVLRLLKEALEVEKLDRPPTYTLEQNDASMPPSEKKPESKPTSSADPKPAANAREYIDQAVEALIARLDHDGDGQVDIEEAERDEGKLKHVFDQMDENGDDVLSRDEMRAYAQSQLETAKADAAKKERKEYSYKSGPLLSTEYKAK
jgi:hypothetical protein